MGVGQAAVLAVLKYRPCSTLCTGMDSLAYPKFWGQPRLISSSGTGDQIPSHWVRSRDMGKARFLAVTIAHFSLIWEDAELYNLNKSENMCTDHEG